MKKRCFFIVISLLFVIFSFKDAFAAANIEEGVGQLAEKISQKMIEGKKQKIAIVDFSDLNGNVTALGQFLAEELTTRLFDVAPGKFEVVERRMLLKLEEELILGQTGFIEEKSIKKMGQVLGVDAIVTGSMTDLGNSVKINARLIGVDSAKVFAVAATDIPKTGTVADLIGKQAEKRPGTIQSAQTPNVQGRQKTPGTQGVEKVFQNDFFKVNVKSLKKEGKKINLVLVYENVTDKQYNVGYHSNGRADCCTYLVNENGEQWNWIRDDGQGMVNSPKFALIPKTKFTTKLTFIPKEKDEGKLFAFISKHWHGDNEFYGNEKSDIIISDISVE